MNKLVRGKIVSILQEGSNVSWRTLDNDNDFKKALFDKLKEEVNELLESQNLEEIADVTEVLNALIPLCGSIDEYNSILVEKREAKGDFSNRIFVDKVEFNSKK